MQNKYARLVLNADWYSSQCFLMTTLNWQTVEHRIKYQYCLLVFKVLNNLIAPTYLEPLISRFNPSYCTRYSLNSIQLTNWILWNGKFYYRDVIKMTITRAKGEGNGHFYHIEVIDLPFHTIPFVSCFISLIENTKKWTFIENLQANLG